MLPRHLIGAALLAAALLLPAAAQASYVAYATGSVNLREGPGTRYHKITVVRRNARVTVHGCVRGHSWCDVTYRGYRGWVSGRYIAVDYGRHYRRPLPGVAITLGVPVYRTWYDPPYWRPYYRRYHGPVVYRDRYIYRDHYYVTRRVYRRGPSFYLQIGPGGVYYYQRR